MTSDNATSSTTAPARLVPNPEHAELGLPAEEDVENLETALERAMGEMVLPQVGEAPDEDL